jgi:hypothetical protein
MFTLSRSPDLSKGVSIEGDNSVVYDNVDNGFDGFVDGG